MVDTEGREFVVETDDRDSVSKGGNFFLASLSSLIRSRRFWVVSERHPESTLDSEDGERAL